MTQDIAQKKVPASSILEVVVALVLVMVVFGIAMMLFVNVTRSSVSLQQLNGGLLLHDLYLKTKEEKSFFNEEIKTGHNVIYKKVGKYRNIPSLILLEMEIVNPEQKQLAARKDILLIATDE